LQRYWLTRFKTLEDKLVTLEKQFSELELKYRSLSELNSTTKQGPDVAKDKGTEPTDTKV
jgi:hypothetical protein